MNPDTKATQQRDQAVGVNQGLTVLSYLIGGVLVWGLFGWLGDHLLGTGFLLPVGIILGAIGGIYLVIKRFGDLPERGSAGPRS